VNTRRSTALALVIALVLLQIWLLSAAVDAAQARRPGRLAATAVSAACLLASLALFRAAR